MFYLNRFARTTSLEKTRQIIYSLKTRLIRQLYEGGYCTGVRLSIRQKECWGCGGTGQDWSGGLCKRCGGSGIYSSVPMYNFTFRVGRRVYCWHQPGSQVNWPVTFSKNGAPAVSEPALPPRGIMNRELCLLYVFTVAEYLHGQGAESGLRLWGVGDVARCEWQAMWGWLVDNFMKGSSHGRNMDF